MTKDQVYGKKVKLSEVNASSGSKFLGATLLYLTFALLITFAVVGAMGGILTAVLEKDSVVAANTFTALMTTAIVLYIPTLIWVQISAFRNGKTVGAAFFLYSIVMGLLISPICIVAGFLNVALALGTTCLAFALMALIAWNSKKDFSRLSVFATGLLLGLFVISLVDLIISLIIGFDPLYWIVSIGFFIVILLLTVADLKRIQVIANNGGATKNIALLCALNLYVDFVYIFIRLLRLIVIVRNNR